MHRSAYSVLRHFRKEMPKLICIVIQLSEELKQQFQSLRQRGYAGFIILHQVEA